MARKKKLSSPAMPRPSDSKVILELIQYNEKEYFAIKLTDGMYDEDNEKYLAGHDIKKQLKYKLQYIMHWADHMSTVIERQDVNF